jgi:hypothetical protein
MRDSKSAVAACRPTEGSTYLTIGQDLFSIEEYLREQYNASLHEYTAKSNMYVADIHSGSNAVLFRFSFASPSCYISPTAASVAMPTLRFRR